MKIAFMALVVAAAGTVAYYSKTKNIAKTKTVSQATVEVPAETVPTENISNILETESEAPLVSSAPTEVIESRAPINVAIEEPAPKKPAINKVVAKKKAVAKKAKPALTAKTSAKTPELEKSDKVSTQQASTTTQLNGNLQNLMGGNSRSRFRGTVEFGVNTDMKTFDDPTKSTGTSLFFRPRYAINDKYTALLNAWVDKGISQGFEDRLNDLRMGVFRNPIKKGKLLFIPNIIATVPTSERSKRNQDMIMGIEFNPNLVYLQNDLLNFFFTPRLRRNFHEFTTSRTNDVNTEYTFMGIAGFSYSLTDKFSFQPALIYVQNRSYEGTDRDPNYLTALEGRYQIDRKSYALFGTTTGGSIYATEMGPDQNIELFDENTTSVYANYGFLF